MSTAVNLGVDGAVIEAAQADLAKTHAERGSRGGRLAFRQWIPNGARKTRRRLFVASVLDGEPIYVAKVPLDPADRMVERELGIMRMLPVGGPRRPLPVAALGRGMVMSWVPERDLPEAIAAAGGTAGLERIMCGCVDLMVDLHRLGTEPTVAPEAVAREFLGADLDLAGEAALDALSRARVGPAHGDLGPWNVRENPATGALALIDWEDYLPAGIQVIDLLNLVFTCALVVFPEYPERGFGWLGEQIFDPAGPFRGAVRTALRRYARRTGQPAADLARLLPVSSLWLIRRIENQGRSAADMFYRPLMDHYLAIAPTWIGDFDD